LIVCKFGLNFAPHLNTLTQHGDRGPAKPVLSFHIIPGEGREERGGRCVKSAATPYSNRTEYTLL